MKNKTINRHLSHFNIAGFTYWEGCVAIQELKIGSRLRLVREVDNKFDPYAVALYFEEHKLGCIPQDENQFISQFLDLGYTDMFDVRVQRLSPDTHPEKQVGVVVFIKEANEVFNK